MILGEKKHMLGHVSTLAITASLAVMSFGVATSAMAQDADANGEVVVVTGIKKGIQDSIAAKRKSASIIEVVSAEDIGKLPDISIADSLARLPGLAGQRVNGRQTVISIRGFDPDFGATLLNGRLQVSTGDNRAAEFDQYPAELINRGTVYKTPQSDIIGGGLSGTVDLSTARPLDFKKRVVSFSVRGSTNSNDTTLSGATNKGNRISFAYIDQFMDGKLGVSLGYAHLDDPTSVQHFKYWGFEDASSNAGTCLAPGQTNGWCGPVSVANNAFGPGKERAWRLAGFEAQNITRTNVRDGFMGAIDFKPNDNFRSLNDFYYSKFEQHEQSHGLMGTLGMWGGTGPDTPFGGVNRPGYTNAGFVTLPGAASSTNGNNLLNVSGTTSNIRLINRSDFGNRTDTMYAFGSKNTWSWNQWDMMLDLSTSSATRKEVSGTESYAGVGPTLRVDGTGLTSLTYSFPLDGDGPMRFSTSVNFDDASLLRLGDVAGWGADGHIRYPKIKDRINQIQFGAKRDMDYGIIKGVSLGIAESDRSKEKTIDEYDLCLKGTTTVCGSTGVALPSAYTVHSDFGYLGLGSIAGIDLENGLNSIYTLKPILDENHYDKFWKVEEKITTTYVKFDVEGSLFSVPYHGNFGTQIAFQTQHSIGNVIKSVGGVVKVLPYDKEINYSNVLPSLNLNFDLTENTMLRFGVGRSMARPRMDDLRANAKAGLSPIAITANTQPHSDTAGTWSGNGGNPELRPWLADSIDISLEKYFSKRTYVSLAYYTKDLKSYIYNQPVVDFDFTGYPVVPDATGITRTPYICGHFTGNTCDTYVPGNIGTFTQPRNGQGGKADGVEFAASIAGEDVISWLDGFGIQGSYSKRWTDIRPLGPTNSTPLPGFSGWNHNLTVYYEKHGFSARLSQNTRSAFRAEVPGLFSTRTFSSVLEEQTVDGQLSYTFPEGRFHGLSLVLQGYNLTDSPYRTSTGAFPGGVDRPETYDTYGKQILFGFNWKM